MHEEVVKQIPNPVNIKLDYANLKEKTLKCCKSPVRALKIGTKSKISGSNKLFHNSVKSWRLKISLRAKSLLDSHSKMGNVWEIHTIVLIKVEICIRLKHRPRKHEVVVSPTRHAQSLFPVKTLVREEKEKRNKKNLYVKYWTFNKELHQKPEKFAEPNQFTKRVLVCFCFFLHIRVWLQSKSQVFEKQRLTSLKINK